MHVSGNNPLSPFFVLPSLNHITNDTTTKTTVVKSVRNGTAIPPPIFFLTMIGPHGYTAWDNEAMQNFYRKSADKHQVSHYFIYMVFILRVIHTHTHTHMYINTFLSQIQYLLIDSWQWNKSVSIFDTHTCKRQETTDITKTHYTKIDNTIW